jgi:hypothetical protein
MIDWDAAHVLGRLSSVSTTALFTAAITIVVLMAGVYLWYRRLRRDGRWDRVMGRHQPKSAPRRDLDELRLRADQAVDTARDALAVLEPSLQTGLRLGLVVGGIEDLGRWLCQFMDQVSRRGSEDSVTATATALVEPVAGLQELARRVAAAAAATVRGSAAFDLRQLDSEASLALQAVARRQATLDELGQVLEPHATPTGDGRA